MVTWVSFREIVGDPRIQVKQNEEAYCDNKNRFSVIKETIYQQH